VHTAVAVGHGALRQAPQVDLLTSITQVTFRALARDEIERYCATSEPYDKAGAYGIQGLAALFVAHLEGSYTGVMGLPLFETGLLLQRAGFVLP
jgi:septum formation protein